MARWFVWANGSSFALTRFVELLAGFDGASNKPAETPTEYGDAFRAFKGFGIVFYGGSKNVLISKPLFAGPSKWPCRLGRATISAIGLLAVMAFVTAGFAEASGAHALGDDFAGLEFNRDGRYSLVR